jgi:hypothetical protein
LISRETRKASHEGLHARLLPIIGRAIAHVFLPQRLIGFTRKAESTRILAAQFPRLREGSMAAFRMSIFALIFARSLRIRYARG